MVVGLIPPDALEGTLPRVVKIICCNTTKAVGIVLELQKLAGSYLKVGIMCKYQVPSTKYQVPSTKYQVPSTVLARE